MKAISTYIIEKFQVGNNNINKKYTYHPKDKDELIQCIKDKIEQQGLGAEDEPLDLNDIDVSNITDMSNLFDALDGSLIKLSVNGNFDISDWDVSNVKTMYAMFWGSKFKGNLSDWDVSKVINMNNMFTYCKNFNCDISDWNVKNVESMGSMFAGCPLEKNPPKWYNDWFKKVFI